MSQSMTDRLWNFWEQVSYISITNWTKFSGTMKFLDSWGSWTCKFELRNLGLDPKIQAIRAELGNGARLPMRTAALNKKIVEKQFKK